VFLIATLTMIEPVIGLVILSISKLTTKFNSHLSHLMFFSYFTVGNYRNTLYLNTFQEQTHTYRYCALLKVSYGESQKSKDFIWHKQTCSSP